jgi:hypothetical protein
LLLRTRLVTVGEGDGDGEGEGDGEGDGDGAVSLRAHPASTRAATMALIDMHTL